MAKIGPREAELRRMREDRANQKPSKPVMGFEMNSHRFEELTADEGADPSQPETTPMKKTTAKKTVKKQAKKKTVAKAKPVKKAKAAKAPKAGGKKNVSAQEVADFITGRPGGVSMSDLETKFGIPAHPMRAKIYYIRNTLKIDVTTKDGRYFGPPAKA